MWGFFNLKRRDQVIISKFNIGHSKLTHIYILKGKQQHSAYFVIQHDFGVYRHLTREELDDAPSD